MQTPAEFVRGLSQSVNIVKMFIMLVWEALEAPGGLEKVREVGQQGVGGGVLYHWLSLLRLLATDKLCRSALKKVAIS